MESISIGPSHLSQRETRGGVQHVCKKSQCLITVEGYFDARAKLDMAKTILFESQTPGSKNLRMCPPMRGSTVLSTSMRRISRPSICLDIDSTTHPALRRSVKGSERRPKPRHKIVPFDRGRPKPYHIWHGLRAFVVVRDGNAVIEAKERRWFCGQGSEVSGCGMPKNF